MGKHYQVHRQIFWQIGLGVAAICAVGPAWAAGAPEVEPRVLTQLGLETPLALNLLQGEIAIIDNFTTSPPACTKLVSAGSEKTFSVKMVSKTEYTSKVDVYFDAVCKKPYFESEVTVTVNDASEKLSFTETATYFLASGKELGKFASSNILSVVGKTEIVGGRGKFTPVGGQPAAEVGFVCTVPTSGKSLVADCQSGVAQTFKSLNLSVASVVPFTLTSASNNDGAKVTFKGTESDVRTGPAGSLTITAPKPGELGIGGGGTVYTPGTVLSGSESKFTLFPPSPTLLSVTDATGEAKFSYKVLTSASRGASATVVGTVKDNRLATLTTDETGTGKVKYSDGSSAAVRGFLAGD